MPQDHPDGTLPIAFSKSDIKVPVDIQAQYITLDVDIVAQAVGNISIDIAAQTVGNIEVDIKAATAKVAVTIAAADITGNIPIDITAQTVGNIDIDIAAQTVGNIDINLAASAITLDINIASQAANVDVNIAASAVTITVSVSGTANIDITAQSVGVFLQPDWQTAEGNYKSLEAGSANIAISGQTFSDYTVPAGKTFYICMFTGASQGTDAADRDAHQIIEVRIESPSGSNRLVVGADSGFISPISPPIKIGENTDVRLRVVNFANHVITARSFITGYEV